MTALTITVCGHVDAGKTKFIDVLTQLNVVAQEHSQITQKLSIYELGWSNITKFIKAKAEIVTDLTKLFILDTPGHLAFKDIKGTAFNVSHLVLVFTPFNADIDITTFELLKQLKQLGKPYLLVFTRLDEVPGWQNDLVFRKNIKTAGNLELYEQRVYKHTIAAAHNGIDLSLYSGLNNNVTSFTAISSISYEGFTDLFAIFAREAQQLITDYNITDDYVILDSGLQTANYYTGLLLKGTIKHKGKIYINNVQYPVKKLYTLPYQNLQAVAELKAPASFAIDIPLSQKQKFNDVGLIVKAKSKGALRGLCSKLIDAGWPIALAEVGTVTKVNRYMIGNQKPPYNLILSYYSGVDTAYELYSPNIFRLFEKVEACIAKHVEKQKQQIVAKYKLAKLELLPSYIFKREKPYVLGVKLVVGACYIDTTFVCVTNKHIKFKVLGQQKSRVDSTVVTDIECPFAIKISSNATLEELVSTTEYITQLTSPLALIPIKADLDKQLWNSVVYPQLR